MRQLACILTTVSFFSVTILEKGMLIICILVSCGLNRPAEAIPAQTKCSPCCESKSTCAQNILEDSKITENKNFRFCQILLETSVSYKQRCECNLVKPNLTATYEKHNSGNFRIIKIRPTKIYSDCDRLADILVDQSRPRGVHYTIPTTVLLI